MAQEPWNRINVLLPSAVYCVCVPFTPKTDVTVSNLLVENGKVLKLLRHNLLQTEVRVLYDLLYNLNNSSRGNKTFRVMKQVEQCINRLKDMKLDVALQDLYDVCPKKIQRKLSKKVEECELPSQPMLEWLCLKVLGAAQLMICTMKRCSKGFVLSRQHMKFEFVILNMVITSMFSRFWVIFRGILASLCSLYRQLYDLRGKVSDAKPMPFLTDYCLPADVVDFLGPSDASLLPAKHKIQVKAQKGKVEKQKPPIKTNNLGPTRKIREDLGVAVQRELEFDSDIKPIQNIFGNIPKKILPKEKKKDEKKQMLQRQVNQVSTFKDMASCLEELILWCKSKKTNKRERLLTFLRLKCRRLRGLEAAGYKVQKKLKTFKQEACQAFCGVPGPVRKTCPPAGACRRLGRLRTRVWTLRMQFRSPETRRHVKRKQRQKKCVSLGLLMQDGGLSEMDKATACTVDSGKHDDIDEIFACVGL
ncbi:nucleolus and neural progenitor protein isoform X2 [Nerophis ophidion]|uniref:nucleolus and neural progenitor protein isoform X2 n=1 Tax=Nerophis ophidion TaxID=159077 RepID=UPI002ADF3128|nr:nucleolus and neural progenitor protein isoform X2 [Nerophis ophidion]